MDMQDIMREMMDNMPDELKALLKDMVFTRVDAMVADSKRREQMRERVKDDPNALKGFECACHMYDLNMQIVQSLSIIKGMLSSFDENDLSSNKAESNMHLFKHIAMLIGLTTEDIHKKVNEYEEEDDDHRNGDASGPGVG